MPNWHHSNYRGYRDWDTDKYVVLHDTPVRCPYCGKEMGFASPIFYEYHTSDWYWYCSECGMKLPNDREFPKDKLDKARKNWRKHLKEEMDEAKGRYQGLKKLYEAYGRYYTPEEKRERLIETIEEHETTKPIE